MTRDDKRDGLPVKQVMMHSINTCMILSRYTIRRDMGVSPGQRLYAFIAGNPGAVNSLYEQLRLFDKLKLDRIFVEAVPDGSAWDGVRDRLERASAEVST